MSQIDREGTFRGDVLEHAVNTTKNGYPQLVVRARATEMYDADTGEWTAWAEYEQEIVGYIVLFGAKGPCGVKKCMDAFGWDGDSFASLADMDLSSTPFQFDVEPDTYEGKTTLQMTWIRNVNATPGRSCTSLDAKGLTDLDKKFKLGKKAVAPATPPTGKPDTPPASKPKADPTPAASAAEPTATAAQNAADESTPTTPPAPVTPPKAKAKASKSKKTASVETCSRDEAWARVCEFKAESVEDNDLNDAWVKTIEDVIGPDGDTDTITPEQWAQVRDKVLDSIDHIPF